MKILRLLDHTHRLIGYVDIEVAMLNMSDIQPGVPFEATLFGDRKDIVNAVTMPTGQTDLVQRVTLRVDQAAFYGPGKYAGAPPDAVLYDLIVLEQPDNLWDYPGWIKREATKGRQDVVLH